MMAQYEHVVIIGVDGAGAFFREADTPNTDRIFTGGAVSYNVLTAIPTISAQCWGSLLHGVAPEIHRLTNGIVSNTPYDVASPYPSIFRIVREAYPQAELASFCNWNPINIGIVENNLGVYMDTASDEVLTEKIVAYLDDHTPKLLFVQFDSVDGAGHGNGYGTPNHLASITNADGLIGQIYDKYQARNLLGSTLFIVTADHGGTPGGSHGGESDAEKYVYLGLAGKTVEASTPVDCEIRDLAAIAAYALGLELPDTWTGRVPGGIFKGVAASERKIPVIPKAAHRSHVSVPTPAADCGRFLTDILAPEKIRALLLFDGDTCDVSGHFETENHGKLYYANGYYGSGIALDDGYITLKNCKLSKDSFTLAMWLKTGGGNGDPVICGNKDWRSGLNDGFVLSLSGHSIHINAGDGTTRMDMTAFLPLDYVDGWVHVILTVDRIAGKVKIFYDFEKAAEAEIPSALTDIVLDALDFNIGQDGTGKYPSQLSAMLDDFILYSDAMSDAEIVGLKGYYIQ